MSADGSSAWDSLIGELESAQDTLADLIIWLADLGLGVDWFTKTPPPRLALAALCHVYAMRDGEEATEIAYMIDVETNWPGSPAQDSLVATHQHDSDSGAA